MRKIGWFFIISSVMAILAELFGLKLPTISWAFNMSYDTSFLRTEWQSGDDVAVFAWFGYLVAVIGIVVGILMLVRFPKGAVALPTTLRRIQRFKANKRGYLALKIVLVIVFLAALDQLLVGKRAIYVNYNGKVFSPALMRAQVKGKELGLTGDKENREIQYRDLKKMIKDEGKKGTVLMPLVPYDPTGDTVKTPYVELHEKDGILLDRHGKPKDGRVAVLYDKDSESSQLIYEYRKGLKHGVAIGKTREGDQIYKALYQHGKLVPGSEEYSGKEMSKEEFLASAANKPLCKVLYNPAPPMAKHWLGTTPNGNDVVAYLFGGLQVNIRAALIYIPAIYIIGVTLGLIMGYFGGVVDLAMQRFIEVFSTIPFLFVVIIFSSMLPSKNRGLMMILVILIAFGWMGMTYLMRTAAMKEKARDYVAAARVSGASTGRILFQHILPNTVAILVTLVPFSVSGIITALTSLDYLGFGLPPNYATWGRLLKEGLDSFSHPWLVLSAFSVLVITLILITFIGEAVRDAFDPKKFSTYK